MPQIYLHGVRHTLNLPSDFDGGLLRLLSKPASHRNGLLEGQAFLIEISTRCLHFPADKQFLSLSYYNDVVWKSQSIQVDLKFSSFPLTDRRI